MKMRCFTSVALSFAFATPVAHALHLRMQNCPTLHAAVLKTAAEEAKLRLDLLASRAGWQYSPEIWDDPYIGDLMKRYFALDYPSGAVYGE